MKHYCFEPAKRSRTAASCCDTATKSEIIAAFKTIYGRLSAVRGGMDYDGGCDDYCCYQLPLRQEIVSKVTIAMSDSYSNGQCLW